MTNQEQQITPPEFTETDNRVTTTSLEVARIFERRHKDILRLCRENFTHGCIMESAYKDARGNFQPMFHITSAGLVLLMDHFTETEFTLSRFEYLGECFEKAEAERAAIQAQEAEAHLPHDPEGDRPTPEEWQQTWDKMNMTYCMVCHAVTNLYDDVNAMTKMKKHTSIEGRYSELRNAARKIQWLENMLVWFSPRANYMNMRLNEVGEKGIK
jgi:phage regulator Rha-like protein